ncbi:MAG TPA: hypothetical protein VMK32_12830 [Burkholderiaceae bacterium]|nr:hypothetical protein [Burkholderiaceae bacterium]
MNFKTCLLQASAAAALLAAMIPAGVVWAADAPTKSATPAKPAPKSKANMMTRDELRACMDEQDRLAKISATVKKDQEALDVQLAEVKKIDAELARKREALAPEDAAGRQAILDEEVKRDSVAEIYNTKLRSLREQAKSFDDGRAAWVQQCTTRDYDEMDEAAIMKERRAAAAAAAKKK